MQFEIRGGTRILHGYMREYKSKLERKTKRGPYRK
jgi:hypothetical protein